jgi:hypothetical protein
MARSTSRQSWLRCGMPKRARNVVEDLRGASRLAVDATTGVTGLVEALHRTIASGPAVLGAPLERPATALTGVLYGAIRGVTNLVGAGIDLALGQLAPLLGDGLPGAEREAVLAAVNGVLGDYLAATHNPLAIPMRLRRDGHPLTLERAALREALPKATGRVLVMLHGSSMNTTCSGTTTGTTTARRSLAISASRRCTCTRTPACTFRPMVGNSRPASRTW